MPALSCGEDGRRTPPLWKGIVAMFEPRTIASDERLNKRQRAVAVIMNLLLLIELTVCMYLGQNDPDDLTMFFLKTFLPAAAVTLVTARLLIRRMR